jgi:subtilisin family serine protease
MSLYSCPLTGPGKTKSAACVALMFCLFVFTTDLPLAAAPVAPVSNIPVAALPHTDLLGGLVRGLIGSSGGAGYIVRHTGGLSGIQNTCLLLGCQVVGGLDGTLNQLFLVNKPSPFDPVTFLMNLLLQPGVVAAEPDQQLSLLGASAGTAPWYLSDRTPVPYYGTTVWEGYVKQTPNQLIRTDDTHSTYHVAGTGIIVAIIDTGVDPDHPVLKPSLLPGYDFTRNQNDGSEMGDVGQSTVGVLDGSEPAQVNDSSIAVVNQSTVGVLDGSAYAAFGHGTMTAGIVHLVAPQAKILPLKAFSADGTGYKSDILRAIYYAVGNGARVISMSFSFPTYSPEMARAVNFAAATGVISVASAGNDGQQVNVYPAALPNVIDVASTGNQDIPSTFSNYGAPPVWISAPGEAVMTTYPWGTYAAGWGTSFSAPFTSGTAALLLNVYPLCNQHCAAYSVSKSQPIDDSQYGYGRLDTFKAIQSLKSSLGLF